MRDTGNRNMGLNAAKGRDSVGEFPSACTAWRVITADDVANVSL